MGKEVKEMILKVAKINCYLSASCNKAATVDNKLIVTLVCQTCSDPFEISKALSGIYFLANLQAKQLPTLF